VRVEVHSLPPVSSSPNWRGHWSERYKASRIYQSAVFYCCVDAKNRASMEGTSLPVGKARIALTFIFSNRRRRDRDNLLARFKPGLDGIVQSGLLLDDDSEHLQIGEVDVIVDKHKAPLTIIDLEAVE